MSVGPEFDPSLLDGKDRTELLAIATSLGLKPSARTKKAEVKTMILDLVGIDEAANPETGGPQRDRSTGREGSDADQPRTSGAPSGQSQGAALEPSVSEATKELRANAGVALETSVSEATKEHRANTEGGPEKGNGSNRSSEDQADESAPAGDDGPRRDRSSGRDRPDGDQRARPGAPSEQQRRAALEPSVSEATKELRANTEGGPETGNRSDGSSEDRGDRSASTGGTSAGEATNDLRASTDELRADSDEFDPANRRRRRRGRDRERRPDGEGPGQGSDTQPEPVSVEGLVELRDEGYGFLRVKGFLPSRDDAYVSVKQSRQFGLRTGDTVRGKARPANRNEKNPALLQVEQVNGHPAHSQPPRRRFEELTPLFPDERLRLELADDPTNATVRIIDLVSPIGKGQRGLIVSPPKAGKTTVMKHIARSIEVNHPEVELIVLLVDERPEEVTDMRRWLSRGEVAASTFDRPAEEHTAVAELVIERAKRMVEDGKDVVVILDGITRLARAYNLAAPPTGRVMAGGMDSSALYPPKKFFGAARNAEEGGSLTILATALVETNTRMDEVIFEEFKGTGNMELKLDRKLAERRIYPAIDVDASSTRHEELLFDRQQLQQVWKLRRVLGALRDDSGSGASGLEMLTDRLGAFRTNDEFLAEIPNA